jgi:uncharacterized coiled-coil protein SlyX
MSITEQVLHRLAWLEYRLSRLETDMSRVDDVIADINTATDEIASDLEALREQVSGLDAVTAEKFGPIVERLRSLGQDPQDPVPTQPTQA